MATKKSQTAKVAPKATKTVTTSTGKTKTMPAKKPATKPAPRAKTTTTKSSKTTAKTTKTAKPTKPASKTGRVIACIIGTLAAIALVVIVIIMIVYSMNSHADLTVKTADGQKITTEYVGFNDNKFKLKIPTSFHALSADEVKAEYITDSGNTKAVVYANDDKKITIAVAPTDTAATNDNIKSSAETLEAALKQNGQNLTTDYYTQGNYNIANLKFDGPDTYEHLIFFAQDNKLTTVTFSCPNDERDNWQGVGNFIMKSLEFNE